MDVVWRGFDAGQDHGFLRAAPPLRLPRVEHDDPGCGAWRRIEPFREEPPLLLRDVLLAIVEARQQEIDHVVRLDPTNRLLACDEALRHEVHGNLHCGPRGPFPLSRLEDPQLPALDRELDVLEVAVVLLEPLRVAPELRDLQWRANPGDDVLALRVHQILTVEPVLSRGGVPCENDAGPGVLAHVPEDHRLDVRGRPEIVRYLVEVPIVDRALPVPRPEDGEDRLFELAPRVLRELLVLCAEEALELRDDLAEHLGRKVRVLLARRLRLPPVQNRLEPARVDAQYDAAEHLEYASIRVPSEPVVPRHRGDRGDGPVVEAEVQDRVHHARHRELRTAPDGDEERACGVTELPADRRFDSGQCVRNLFLQSRWELSLRGVRVAGPRRDREAGRHGKAEAGHLREAGPLSAEEVLHSCVSLLKKVHVLRDLPHPERAMRTTVFNDSAVRRVRAHAALNFWSRS